MKKQQLSYLSHIKNHLTLSKKKTKQNKTKQTHTNKTGFVTLVEIRRSYSELSRDKEQQRRNETSHSWSTENVKQSTRKLTSSQLFMNETFPKQVKTWLADGMWKCSVQG